MMMLLWTLGLWLVARIACMAESWGRGHLEVGSGVSEPAVCPGKPEKCEQWMLG